MPPSIDHNKRNFGLPTKGTIPFVVLQLMIKGTDSTEIDKALDAVQAKKTRISKIVETLEDIYGFEITRTRNSRDSRCIDYKIKSRNVKGEFIPIEKLPHIVEELARLNSQ